jgi:hypothetical protein
LEGLWASKVLVAVFGCVRLLALVGERLGNGWVIIPSGHWLVGHMLPMSKSTYRYGTRILEFETRPTSKKVGSKWVRGYPTEAPDWYTLFSGSPILPSKNASKIKV